MSACLAAVYGAPESVRVRRHWHQDPYCYEAQPQVVLVEKPCAGNGLQSSFCGAGYGGPGPIIQVVEKGACASGLGPQQPPLIVVEQEAPAPIIISDDQPLRLKHVAEPYVVENFNTQYIIDHYQGARIEKFQRLPTIVDHYLPAEVQDISEGGPITVQLDCAGNPVGQVRGASFGGLGSGVAFSGGDFPTGSFPAQSLREEVVFTTDGDFGHHGHDAGVEEIIFEKTTIIDQDEHFQGDKCLEGQHL